MEGKPSRPDDSCNSCNEETNRNLPKLPVADGYFPELRSEGRAYVDKTEIIHRLLTKNNAKAVFLSRPRRFGKTLLMSTVEAILQGREELFQGLDIADPKLDFKWKKGHVIQLSLVDSTQEKQGFDESLTASLHRTAQELGVTLCSTTSKDAVMELINALYDSYGDIVLRSNGDKVLFDGLEACADHKKVSVLIDESDFPLLANYNNPGKLRSVQSTLSEFYTALKRARDKGRIDFLLVTGITRFKELLADSGMNILSDITFVSSYSQICGFTPDEIDATFKNHLNAAFEARKSMPAAKQHSSVEDLFSDLKEWYDGYSWDGETEVLNPHSVLQFLDSKEFSRYWYRTGAPGFLRQLDIHDVDYFKIYAKNTVSEEIITDDDLTKISAPTALLMTGYLSVRKIDKSRDVEGSIFYHLSIPNKEVKMSFAKDHLIDRLYPGATEKEVDEISALYKKFGDAMSSMNVDAASKIFSTLLSNFPAEHIKTEERFFQHELSRAFRFMEGLMLEESRSGDGRPDFVFKFRDKTVLVVEVKYNKTDGLISELKTEESIDPYSEHDVDDDAKRSVLGSLNPLRLDASSKTSSDEVKQSRQKPPKKRFSHDELVKKCLDRGINSAFNQIYNLRYARKFLWQGNKVYAVAISIVDRSDVKIDFREVTDNE
ncbi:MAG: AAA family ATPase [Deltaproteobacteria bacterium]|jgi:hypothetical protein|nr:AAA family ATPase [Deltaproteobacteria bacterium]